MIVFKDWEITVNGLLGRQFDNLSRSIDVVGNLPEGWSWTMLVQIGKHLDLIDLECSEDGLSHTLTREQLSLEGYYHLQLRGTQGDVIKHTNVVSVYIPASISGDTNWPTVPSEFLQAEQRIAELNSHPPVPGEHGYWLIWNVTLSRYEESQFSLPAGGSSDSGGTPNAVQYVEQTLTTDQQKQARKNIGAMSADTEIPIVPEALPNPNALTFSGAISATYDGKNAVTIKIPQGGSGDNFGELIASATLKETAATVEITGLNLGVGSYTIIIRGAGGGTAASGLTVELNGISKGGYTGGYGSSASELSLAVLSVLDSRIIGASMMANGGKNEYLWDSFALPITSVSVYSPYHLTDETKYFSAGTVVEIYRGIMLHNL